MFRSGGLRRCPIIPRGSRWPASWVQSAPVLRFAVMTVTPLSNSQQQLPTPEHVLRVLDDHGYRLTGPRRAVITAVLARRRPFTAEQLVEELPAIGRATVYRTLEILASVDLLTRLLQPGCHPAYVVGQPGHRHHLVCSECGVVVAFTRCPVDDLLGDLTRDTDFAIHGHHLEVFGLCPRCQVVPAPTMATSARA
ncbi:MAG: Fur family transcriptional regulator, ferric uptake regulator [Thermomicrobiales bacterium]|nr:Fur family transcriptional regulator, ferric uptake regulator [Thermomicrobiales bacterium]MEA2597237.1 Fur family transcriptional regulator, ferric uptake regulator [Thermomicrobiales bacterium]